MSTTPTYAERNKDIVTQVITAVFIRRDPLTVMHLFSENYIQHNPLIPNGRDAIPAMIAALPSDFSYTPGMMAADGSIVMIHGRYVGWGPKPMVAVDIFRVENGLLAEHWDVLQEEVPAASSTNGNAMF
ncbi:MAG: nuclear transport factor 2 family protein [Herminiimonas sp.]|nr:nuclear transport factor 2 family protein [Herminiimonas sp.]